MKNFMVYGERPTDDSEYFIGFVQASSLPIAERVATNAYGEDWTRIKEGDPYIEEANYTVRAALTVGVGFAPIPREGPITRQDAISNAVGTMPDRFWDALEDEGWTVEFTAERLD